MKKLLSVILSLVLLLTVVCGCDDNKKEGETSEPTTSSSEVQSADDNSSEDNSSDEDTSSDSETENDSTEDITDNDIENSSTINSTTTPSVEDASTGETPSSSAKPEEEEEKPLRERLRGGINFSTLESGNMKYDSYVYNRDYYDLIFEAGFDHIRLPVAFQYYIVSDPPEYLLDLTWMRQLDLAVKNAIDAGLAIVLDFHHSTYKSDTEGFKAVWRQVAERYRDYPEQLMFEIVNEPKEVSNKWLNDLQLEVVKIIRETNPTRTIALAANSYNTTANLWNVEIPTTLDKNGKIVYDENVIVSIHNYNNMSFTHQGQNWGGSNRPGYVMFSEDCRNNITRDLEICADYEKRTGRQVWISECGMYLGKCYPEEASKYAAHLTSECARLDLAYAYWEFNSGFGLFDPDTQTWKDFMMDNMVITW